MKLRKALCKKEEWEFLQEEQFSEEPRPKGLDKVK